MIEHRTKIPRRINPHQYKHTYGVGKWDPRFNFLITSKKSTFSLEAELLAQP